MGKSASLKQLQRLLVVISSLIGFAALSEAQAARAYFNGTFASVGGVCPDFNGGVTSVIASQSFVGYFTDPNEPYPKTGDIAYVQAVASAISPCSNDAFGFDFFLPDGASPAVSATNPVICQRIRLSDNYTESFGNSGNSGCSQTPSTGTAGGLFFGWSAGASGWAVRIAFPVQFSKKLLGLGGPSSHRLSAVVSTINGNAAPNQPVTVFYQASLTSPQAVNVTASSATLNATLQSYFAGGSLYLDYGTSNALGSSLAPANVPNTQASFTPSSSLTGLNPGTTYYWRYRFVTTDGTFTSPISSFTTTSAPQFALTVSKAGSGAGTVSSNPAGINCGATCAANFSQGAMVSLTATPASGSSFAGWGGACSGTGACSVTMNTAQNVTATFNTTTSPPPPPQIGTLAMTVSGLPSGSSTTLGITGPGGTNLTQTILTGTGVSLSDVAVGQYTVTAPNVTVSGTTYAPNAASQTVTVNFSQTTTVNVVYAAVPLGSFSLSLTRNGTGSGSVSSNPSGINCGTTCTASFTQGTTVTLTASAASGSSFNGWGGACSGTGTCSVTMSAAQSVTATFNTTGTNPPPPPSPPSPPTPPTPPPSGATAAIIKASAPTATASAQKASSNNPVLGVNLVMGSSAGNLQSISLSASGTGNDALDVASVKLYLDANGNGAVDAGETQLAQGAFSANDGTANLTLTSPRAISAGSSTRLLVTLDFNATLAGLPLAAAFGSAGLALLLGWRSRRRFAALALSGALLALTACPSTPTPNPQIRTYQLTLTGVNLRDASNAVIPASGTPISGTELSVTK